MSKLTSKLTHEYETTSPGSQQQVSFPPTYDGSNACRIILPLISHAKSTLLICSPYIGPEYAQLLVQKAASGVAVNVLTSRSANRQHRVALHILLGTNRSPGVGQAFTVFISGIFMVLLGLAFSIVPVAGGILVVFGFMMVLGGAIGLTKYRSKPRDTSKPVANRVKVRVTNSFVHSKIYVADDELATVGSANLTWSGLNRNVEHLEVFEGQRARFAAESFIKLWNEAT